MEAKTNHRLKSSEKEFYQTMMASLQPAKKKKGKFGPSENDSRNNSAISGLPSMSPRVAASISEKTKFDDKSIG